MTLDTNITTQSDIDIRDALFDELYKIASVDKDIILLSADLSTNSLEKFKKDLKNQYINAGIAEQNIIGIAAGLALNNKTIFIYGIASFITTRCYEQIKTDLSCMNLHVIIIGSGPGIMYSSDGPTHHAVQDISIIRALPRFIIYSPSESISAKSSINLSYKDNNPVYIRVDKGKYPTLYSENHNFKNGLHLFNSSRNNIDNVHTSHKQSLLIITTGTIIHQAFEISNELSKYNIDIGIVDIFRVKPINEKLLIDIIKKYKKIITLEEHTIIGGIGSIISEILTDNEITSPLKRFGIADMYCEHYGDREWMRSFYSIDTKSVVTKTLQWLNLPR